MQTGNVVTRDGDPTRISFITYEKGPPPKG